VNRWKATIPNKRSRALEKDNHRIEFHSEVLLPFMEVTTVG
jgi:hypothetical protein